jgi:uncharacterized protein YuzE
VSRDAVRRRGRIGNPDDHVVLRSPGDERDAHAMRMKVDREADALYIRFDDAKIVESEEVSDGIVLDFDEKGRVVGLEMLGVRQRFPTADLTRMDVEVA